MRALELLNYLGALDDEGNLTEMGDKVSSEIRHLPPISQNHFPFPEPFSKTFATFPPF